MCAIAGIVGLPFEKSILDKMQGTMLRRGPDDTGIFTKGNCALLHTRLAVVDLLGGQQPMTIQWGSEKFTITYNGELYNTEQIRAELIKFGHHFNGHSDTEVMLHAYAQWKERMLEKCNGIFAFGVWEHNRNKLFLARDRMGVKPLFYKCHEGGLIFASEIKTILAYPTVKAQLDATGAAEIFMLGPGRTPGSGVFRGINELEPGFYGYYTCGKLHCTQYWKLLDREHTESFDETVAHVHFLVDDAIRRQMISDVPIGTFLSGGLDSSIISSICANEMQETGQLLHTFSVDYENNDQYFMPGKFQPNSDNHYIQIMEKYLQTKHDWSVIRPEELVGALEKATSARDLPGMADIDFSLLIFCGQIRKHVKVALSGECADEIFGGYPWYRDPSVRAMEGFPWAQNTKQRASFLSEWILQYIEPYEFVMDRYTETLNQCDILPETAPQERRMKQMVNLNQKWFMQTLLDRKDRMSMHNGLEVRVPFCDYRIAEYLYGVPWEYKDYQGKEKGLLRQAMMGILPSEILWRKKSPYPKTYDPKYLQLVSKQLDILLTRKDAPIFQIVKKSALEQVTTVEHAWPWYGQLMKLPQTIAFMLQVNTWMEMYNIEIIESA